MGYRSPSFYRKQGKEAFDQYGRAEEYCPYRGVDAIDEIRRKHWLDGWNDAWLEHRQALIDEALFYEE